ncbi:MAG TPA: acylphosphatase [Candidatus Krumholzibacteria bacterium]
MNEPATYWALHVFISGRVQGVFFRESTRREASGLGLSGWVRNLADGRVEARFEGGREPCERALAFIRTGPPRASVTHVDVEWEKLESAPGGAFYVR